MIGPALTPVGPALTHAGHASGAGWSLTLPLALVLAVLYVAAAVRARPGWPWRRSVTWLGGCALVAAAGSPLIHASLDSHASPDARTHMLVHLLLGMFAPLALTLAAPVTLLLRVCPPVWRRRIVRVLRSGPARVLAHPITGLVLSVGGLYVVVLSPLYAASPAVHQAVQVHYLAAGCLLTWSLVGLDPSPHRARMSVRVGVLVAAAAGHAILAKYAYASAEGMAGELAADARTLEGAAMLMYYGADLAELLLALVLFSSWYAQRGRRLARSRTATDRNPTRVTS